MDLNFNYTFPSLRGVQGGKEYYVGMVPLKLIPKLFLFDEEEVPPDFRAQRTLNKSRIPDITNYIINNSDDYTFSSLTASVDGNIKFEPYSGEERFKNIGNLIISLDARFLINDGQHRRAAIEEALKITPELGDETISIVFYHDLGLKKSQQIFADLNRHAVNTTPSLGILYDHRDQLALITKQIVSEVPLLSRYTDKERVSLSKYSPRLFALNQIFNTNSNLIAKKKGDPISEQEKKYIRSFWESLCSAITEWDLVLKKELTPKDLRANFIVGHGVFLESIGLIGYYLFQNHPTDWKIYIQKLSSIDWTRSYSSEWIGRAYSETGRINKNNNSIQLTANLIKQKLSLPLSEAELDLEKKFERGAMR